MNKKILSIFVMIMALSLFGVSCSNEETTGTTVTPDPSMLADAGTPLAVTGNTTSAPAAATISSEAEVTVGSELTITGLLSTLESGSGKITYTVTGVAKEAGISDADAAEESYTGIDTTFFTATVGTTDNKVTIKIPAAKAKELSNNLYTTNSDTGSKIVGLKLTVTASATGYASTTFDVFVKITGHSDSIA